MQIEYFFSSFCSHIRTARETHTHDGSVHATKFRFILFSPSSNLLQISIERTLEADLPVQGAAAEAAAYFL